MLTRQLGIAHVAVVLGACTAAEGGGGSAAVMRDSAGITIVENDLSHLPDTDVWTVPAEPALTIGSFEGAEEYQLFQVNGAARLGDGRIVVANAGSKELRFYTADGTYLEAAGREGAGPGEFMRMQWLQRFGTDSLAAYDGGTRRISIFGPTGEYIRSLDMNFAEGGDPLSGLGMFDDGTALVSSRARSITTRSESGVRRDTLRYMRFISGTEPRDTLGAFIDGEQYVSADGQRVGFMPLTFGRQPQTSVFGTDFAYASGDQYEIEIHTQHGGFSRLVRATHEPVPVTDEAFAAFRSSMLDEIESDDLREFFGSMVDGQPIPETFPPHGPMTVDRAGYIWVQGYSTPLDSTTKWTVFDPEGAAIGTVTTPEGLRVFDIGEDYVLGSWKDELDVEYVRMHEIAGR